jgi:hypothetical protein
VSGAYAPVADYPDSRRHLAPALRHETKLHTDQVFLTGLRSRK